MGDKDGSETGGNSDDGGGPSGAAAGGRTFTDEQSRLFGRDDDRPERTRQRTPGTESVPPTPAELGVGKLAAHAPDREESGDACKDEAGGS